MKKLVGLGITALGILIIVATFTFTPGHSYNPFDSNSGIDASATLVYSGLIIFGIGLVIYMDTQPFEGEKNTQY